MRDIGKINTKLDELRSKLDAKINAKLSELTNPYVTPTVTQRDRLIAALRIALDYISQPCGNQYPDKSKSVLRAIAEKLEPQGEP